MCDYIMKITDSVFSCFWDLKLAHYKGKLKHLCQLGCWQKLALPSVPPKMLLRQILEYCQTASTDESLRPLSRHNCQCTAIMNITQQQLYQVCFP